jgi:hypothetical protein
MTRSGMWVCLLIAAGLCTALSVGCGGSDDSGASELARQRELAEARREGAQNARQNATIEHLERQLDRLKKEGTATSSEAPAPSGTSVPSSEAVSSSDLGDWPGGSGYSAMLGAFSSEEHARTRQREATELGLDAGVLYSSEFNSLRPGYWIVFSGTFVNHEEAEARAAMARELGYSDSYPRFVSP